MKNFAFVVLVFINLISAICTSFATVKNDKISYINRYLIDLELFELKTITPSIKSDTKSDSTQLLNNSGEKIDDVKSVDEDPNAESRIEYIDKEIENIIKLNMLIDKMNPFIPQVLPIGIGKIIAGRQYSVAIEKMKITPEGAFADLAFVMKDTESKKKIGFEAKAAKFSPKGFEGEARLNLIGEVSLPILNDKANITILGGDETYVKVDCDGFSGLGIKAHTEFESSFIIPANVNGNNAGYKKVSALISGSVEKGQGWEHMIFTVNRFDPFTIDLPGIKDFTFEVTGASFDFSDLRNPLNLKIPVGYLDPIAPGTWRGFYLDRLKVTLPDKFSKKDGVPENFEIRNMLLDNNGLTGVFSANSIIKPGEGNLKGWQFSLDKLEAGLLQSQLSSARFEGQIRIPIEKDENNTGLNYQGWIDSKGYGFNFRLVDDIKLEVPLLQADMTVFKNSQLFITEENHEFIPRAVIQGIMDINNKSGLPLKINKVTFQDLVLQSKKPYFEVGVLSFGFTNSMNKFPLQISNLTFSKRGEMMGLKVAASLNLKGEGKDGFAANAGFGVFGSAELDKNRFKFKFEDLFIDSIGIHVNQGPFYLHGRIDAYKQHDIFGNGFKGMIDLGLEPSIKVQATAQFGNTRYKSNDEYRYFYADAFAGIPGVPIFPGISMYGFGGGIYHHMSRVDNVLKNRYPEKSGTDISKEPGQSLSGIQYIPDLTYEIGVKGKLAIGLSGDPDIFNGDAGMEVSFGEGFSLKDIYFDGSAYFMNKLYAPPTNARVAAQLSLHYNNDKTRTLTGNLDVKINMPKLMEGGGTTNLYFSDKEWYIKVGDPEGQKIGIKMMDFFETQSYFCMGTNIGNIPRPKDCITKYLNIDTRRDDFSSGQLKEGKGIAFGTSFRCQLNDLKFLAFYAGFDFFAGADVLLKNLNDCYCDGMGVPGINGWYAQGQAYAYLKGDIGINAKVGRKRMNYNILSIETAALFRAGLPNPIWMKGVVGGEYNILGGLIKGRCNFEVNAGRECILKGEQNPLEGIKMIASSAPVHNARDINVFAEPQVAFNLKVAEDKQSKLSYNDAVYDIKDYRNINLQYRIVLDHFKLSVYDKPIAGTLQWNHDHTVAAFKPYDVLPPFSPVRIMVKVHFEEKNGNQWTNIDENVAEELITSFYTGQEPDYIDPKNILFAYPIDKQVNYYQGESAGFIQLDKGQNRPFNLPSGYKAIGRLISRSNNKEYTFNYLYDSNLKRVNFSGFNAPKNEIFKLELLKIAPHRNSIDDNVKKIEEVKIKQDSTDVIITTRKVEGIREMGDTALLYSASFRTSMYQTFKEKFNHSTIEKNLSFNLKGDKDNKALTWYSAQFKGDEQFDKFEINNGKNNTRLIGLRASETDKWFKNKVYPEIYKLYEKYKDDGINLTPSAPNLEIPPLNAVFITQNPSDIWLNDNSNEIGFPLQSNLNYAVSYYCYRDYLELRSLFAEYILENSKYEAYHNAELDKFVKSSVFPEVGSNPLNVKMQYSIPILDKKGEEILINIKDK